MSVIIRVLHVEDNPGDARLVSEFLKHSTVRYKVTWAQSLSEALEVIARGRIDVILSDLGLPDSDGVETAMRIMAAAPALPVVIMTGNKDEEHAQRAIAAGVQDYLTKDSLSPELLERAIRYATERNILEQNLKKAFTQLSVIHESAPVAMMLVDTHRVVRSVNRAAGTMVGKGTHEMVGLRGGEALQCMHHLDDPRGCGYGEFCLDCPLRLAVTETFEGTLKKKQLEAWLPIRVGAKEIIRRCLDLTLSYVKIDDEENVLVCAQDITGSKRALAALEESKNRYRHLFESMLDGFAMHEIITDETGKPVDYRFLNVNPAFEEITGLRREEILGRCVLEVMPETEPYWIETYGMVALTGKGARFEQYSGALDKYFQVRAFQNSPGQFATIFQDITEKRKLESSIAQQERLASMGMLAAGLAHEINNPLSFVLANIETLSADLPVLLAALEGDEAGSPPKARGEGVQAGGRALADSLNDVRCALADVVEGGDRIRDVVQNLKLFSRVQDEGVEPVDVEELLTSTLNLIKNEVKYRALLITQFEPVPNVMANGGRLSQVFLNLLINAAHAIEEGHSDRNAITVRLYESDGFVCVDIEDTGSGISPDLVDKIFDPFFTTKEVGSGSGLGLAISNNIITKYGGKIDVRSARGKGTTFVVRMPGHTILERAVTRENPTGSLIPSNSKVLIIDDEEGIRKAVKRALRESCRVTEAASGQEGIALVSETQDYTVILCDVMMPNMAGVEFHNWLKVTYPQLSERLVFVTGGAFTPKTRDYIRDSGVRCLEKPFRIRDLKELVAQFAVAAGEELG